jgi:hypothetical protein
MAQIGSAKTATTLTEHPQFHWVKMIIDLGIFTALKKFELTIKDNHKNFIITLLRNEMIHYWCQTSIFAQISHSSG